MITSVNVLIGRSASGKSAVLEELSRRGYMTIKETAAEVLSRWPSVRDHDELYRRQKSMCIEQVRKESIVRLEASRADYHGPVFLDRAAPDYYIFTEQLLGRNRDIYRLDQIIGYDKFLASIQGKINPREFFKYDAIFSMGALEFNTHGRIEKDVREANAIYSGIEDAYKQLGFHIEQVKAMSIERRADYLLNHVHQVC